MATTTLSNQKLLDVKVLSPSQLLFSGPAHSVSSINSAGKFDILPEHANFITIVENQTIIIRLSQDKQLTFKFPIAIIYNSGNQVRVYTEAQASQTSS